MKRTYGADGNVVVARRSVPLAPVPFEGQVIDMAGFAAGRRGEDEQRACRVLAACVRAESVAVIRHPLIDHQRITRYTGILQRYYARPLGQLEHDVGPIGAERVVGLRLGGTENPRDWRGWNIDVAPEWRSYTSYLDGERVPPNLYDRQHWGVTLPEVLERVSPERRRVLTHERMIPFGIPEWEATMNGWGCDNLRVGIDFCRMLACGLGLEEEMLIEGLADGNTLCGPTGIDLDGILPGTVIGALHYDIARVTLHGPATHPALICYRRDGRPFLPKTPPGCLFAQVGMETERLTGGECTAGMHEIVVHEGTLEAVAACKARGESIVRVTTTEFVEGAEDTLEPKGQFATDEALEKYPPVRAATYHKSEFEVIGI